MATVELENVRKTYGGGVEAVKGVSLAVPDGALCVLVGPSGCGKSTLLRMVAGLESVTAGSIRIGGRAVDRLGPAERDIAMVFQNYALYPHMSVYDNMAYGLRNRATPEAEIEKRVHEAARTLELEPFLKRLPRELSGGQRQRVAMGRAIVRKPSAFLFDEPLSNLDAKLRGAMRVEIKALQRSSAVTSIYVTHDQVEAMTMADLLVVMNAGVAEQVGSPLELYENPASRFVAGFIGSPAMNMIAATADASGVRLANGAVLDGARLGLKPSSGPMVLGVRPEHLAPTASGDADITLDVAGVETLGADTLAHGRLSAKGEAASDRARGDSTMIVARLPGSSRIAPGEVLPLRIAPGSARLFDARSGLSL